MVATSSANYSPGSLVAARGRTWVVMPSVQDELRDLGFKVVAIRYDAPMADQVGAHGDVFG